VTKHTHLYRPHGWLLLTSPADLDGWQRVVFQGKCLVCGDVALFAAEQNTRTMQSRMLEAGT
jgi:hypothetical protein